MYLNWIYSLQYRNHRVNFQHESVSHTVDARCCQNAFDKMFERFADVNSDASYHASNDGLKMTEVASTEKL